MIVDPAYSSDFKTLRNIWEPQPKQIEFARIPFSVFEGFFGGALFGGKSELLIMLPILYRLHEHPKFLGMFFRRTKSQHDETLFLRAQEYYKHVGGDFNLTKMTCTFPAGGQIRFTYLERDEHARDHDGAEYHYVAFDELTHFTEFQYIYITSRIRRSTSDLPTIIRSASNPGNIGHYWVRKRFIEPYRAGGKILQDKHGNKRIFIKSTLKDNAIGLKADPTYENRLQMLPEAERKAKIEGDWWVFSGQVFTEFRDEKREGEPDNALHVIPPFKIPYYWPRIGALDWGYAANTYFAMGAISPSKRLYVYKEYCRPKKLITNYTRDIQILCAEEVELKNIKSIVIDPSSRKHDGQNEKSIFEQIAEGLGERIAPLLEYADNDRISGKLAFHEMLRWEQLPRLKNVTPGGFNQDLHDSIFRNFGAKAALEYKLSFDPTYYENAEIPRLQIFSDCEEFIRVIPLCVYNEDRGNVSRQRKKYEDVAEFSGDDAYDTGRYLLKGVDRYIEEVLFKDEEFKKLDRIHQNFNKSKDQTSYHMAMRLHEARAQKHVKSISRTRIGSLRSRVS